MKHTYLSITSCCSCISFDINSVGRVVGLRKYGWASTGDGCEVGGPHSLGSFPQFNITDWVSLSIEITKQINWKIKKNFNCHIPQLFPHIVFCMTIE